MDPSDFKILPSRSVLSAGRIVRSGVILPLRSPRRLASRARRAGRYRNWFSGPLENRYPPYSTRRWGPMRYSIPRHLPLQTPDPGNWRNGRSPAGLSGLFPERAIGMRTFPTSRPSPCGTTVKATSPDGIYWFSFQYLVKVTTPPTGAMRQ